MPFVPDKEQSQPVASGRFVPDSHGSQSIDQFLDAQPKRQTIDEFIGADPKRQRTPSEPSASGRDLFQEAGVSIFPNDGARDLFAEAGVSQPTRGRFVPDDPKSQGKSKQSTGRGMVDMISDLGLSVWEGAKVTARSIGAASNTVSGDLKDVEGYAAQQRAAADKGPQAKRDLLDEIERRKQADAAPGVVSAVRNVGGAMLDNPEGAAQFVAEQAPNSAVSLGAGWAGAKGGALAGSAFGPVGTAVGGIGGFLGGMFLGNWLLETGSKAMEKAEGGFTQAERSEALTEGATKGAVITGVDALTLGVGGKVAKSLNKAAIEAGARAEARVLADAGVDLTSRAAIEKALAEPALREAAQAAGKQAAKQTSTLGSKAATAGTGMAMETVGEGAGEYLGELAATGKADVYDAVMEAAAGLTQSAPETAWNMRKASGNNLDSRGIARAGAQPDQAGSPVTGSFTNPAPDANQAGQRIAADRAQEQERAAQSAQAADQTTGLPQKRPAERLAELEIQGQTMGLTQAQVSEKLAILQRMQDERSQEPGQGQGQALPQQIEQLSPAVQPGQDPAPAAEAPQQAAPVNFWTFAKSKGYAPGQLRVGTPEHAAIKAEFDAARTVVAGQRASIIPDLASAQGAVQPGQPVANLAAASAPTSGLDQGLQNRDRSRTASVVQMQDIATRPDYMRLGPSRSPDAGAPMVFAVGDDISLHVPEGNEGHTDVAVMADGQRVAFRYAVVDASTVQPSNFADGTANPLFMDTEPGTLKALNNGRTAGLRAAYERGTAEDYRQELMADAAAHGVAIDAIARTPNPILVRVYSEFSNTADMAAKSQGQGLGMSPGELARQDSTLIDASVLAVYQPADVTSASNRDFVRAFVGKLMTTGQDVAAMMTAEGTLSPTGRQRIQAALMQAAYGDADLVHELFDSLDTDIKTIGEALKAVAGEWANMRDSARTAAINPEADITGNLLQAIGLIRQSRQSRQALSEIVSQPDLMTGEVPDSLTVGLLRMFHTGPNLSRAAGRDRLVQDLRSYLNMAMTTSAAPDMFGQTVAPFTIVQDLTTSGDTNDKTATQESQGQPDSRQATGGRTQAARSEAAGPVDDGDGRAAGADRTGEPEATPGAAGPGDAQAAQGDDAAQFQLNAPTPQALRDIEAQVTAIEQRLATERQQGEQRTQADAQRNTFTLTGSDRAADVAAARGQQDIFSGPEPRTPAQKPQEARIEDVGQQLYANRRNFTGRGLKWSDVEGLNDTLKLNEVTKAKIWPRPNYEQLVADGMSPLLARMVKQVYDGISAGPTIRAGTVPTDEQLKRYIDTLSKVREALFAFVNDRQAVTDFAGSVLALTKGGQGMGGPVAITDMLRQDVDAKAVSEALIRRVWPEEYQGSMRPFARGTTAHQEISLLGGNKALGAMQFTRQDFAKWAADLAKNWPTKREAWQVQGWRVLEPGEYTAAGQEQEDGTTHMSIRPKEGRGSWRAVFTHGQLAQTPYLLAQDGGFSAFAYDTREAAIEAARAKVKRDASTGQDIRGTNIEDAERTGPARRQDGEDITAQRLMDAFGFRGVNFGREGWIKQAERQAYLNQAFDGLLDLAEVLGVPPKAMSLNGELGIAFGAQGKGKFAAHFVPGVNEINLTKTRGAGTLAHEWGHALDHHFGKQAGLAKDAEPFMSEHAHKGETTNRMTFEAGKYVNQKGVATFGTEIRPEIVQAFRAIHQTMTKRAESAGEAQTRRNHANEQATKMLDRWLKSARRVIEGSAAGNKQDLLTEFDQHAEKLMQGDTGEGFEQAGKQVFSTRVAAVRNLIKDATGRTWSLDETNGLESSARYARNLLAKKDADTTHEPQLVGTQYKADSAAMDRAKGGKAYWATPTEMFARAFELFVHDRLSLAGARNTFLTDAEERASKPAQVADDSSAMSRASGGIRDLYLYPVGKERETLREAFDGLLGNLKTRETGQGMAIYSASDRSVPLPASDWIDVAVIADELEKRIGQFAHQPPIRIRDSALGLMPGAQDGDAISGAVYNGAVYLFRDQLASTAEVQRTLFHELFHYGLRKIYTKEQFIGEMRRLYDQDAWIKSRADAWVNTSEGAAAASFGGDEYALARGVDEALARLAEPNAGQYTRTDLYSRAVVNVTNWLAKLAERWGFDKFAAKVRGIKNAEARKLIEQIFGALQTRSDLDRRTWDEMDEPAFSRNTMGNQPPAQIPPEQQNAWTKAKAAAAQLTSAEAINKLIYEFQDKYIDLKNLREHIKAIGGTISDLNDAYLGEELFHKRLAKRTEDFLDKELRPLLAEMRANAVSLAEFEKYLHARHAPEANRVLAERNPNREMIESGRDQAKATVRDLEIQLQRATANGSATKSLTEALEQAKQEAATWSGAQSFRGDEASRQALSGMSDEEAKAFIDSLSPRKLAQMLALASRVDAMQAKTLDTLEDYGLMDKTTLNAWRKTYQHYVPLHRDEAHADSDRHPTGQGFSIKGQAAKRRVGSGEAVTNILAHIAMQREAALTRGEKNHVVKKLYLMAAQNPDDEYWQIDAPPEIKTIDSRTGFVRTMVDPAYKHLPHVVMVRIGGNDQAIVFNEHNREAVRLAQAMKNLDIDDLHVVLGLAAKGTRWFASVNTQWSPVFGLINFARDVQAGLLNLSTTDLAGREKDVAKKIPAAMRAIYRERRGKTATNAQWTSLWDEFQEVGGTTGYRDMFADAKDRAKALTDDLQALERGEVSNAAHAVVDWLSDYNETMENSVRLAAYKVALDQGMSRERAASLAKNLTVNFNRKGRQAREIGALYAFFNAAIQGTARMAETLKGPMGRRIIYGGVLLGAVNAMIGMAVMGGGDEDEPNPDRWDQVPEFIKERSIVIPLGREDYLAIPMPLGFHVFPNLGRLAVEFAMGGQDKTMGRQLGKLLQVLADAFNPLGGSQNLGQMVAPTVIDPVVALMQNRDWTGKPIYRENNNPLDPQPGHKMAKDSASTPSRAIAEAINKVTGGTEYRPGAWSPTPDQLDYVIGQLTGGLGRELLKVNQTLAATVTGDELPPYKVPLLGRLYGNTRGPAGQSEQFYANVKTLNEIENEIKGRYRNGQDAVAYRDSEPLSSLVPLANAMEGQVRKLREIRRNLTERKPEGYQERVREVDQRIGQAMERLNAEVSKAQK
jgi:Large polyvalent protein associated domain 38/ddrB-like ParB superfamily domain/Large polyvalent protein-associated domain 1